MTTRPGARTAKARAGTARPSSAAADRIAAVPAGVIVLDPGGTVLAHGPDPRGAGPDPAIAIGVNYPELVSTVSELDEGTAAHLADGIAAVSEGQREIFTLEYPRATADTGPRWIAVTATPFPDAAPRRVLLLHQDVTERKLAEAVLRQNQQRYRRLLDSTREMVVVTDSNGRVKFVNRAVERSLGYGSADYARLAIWELLHPDDLDTAREVLAALLERPGEPAAAEVRVRHLHGHWVWIDTVAWNLLADPEVGALVACGRDASDARLARDALRDAEQRAEAVLDSPRTLLEILAPDGTVLTANRVARLTAGNEGGEPVGRSIWDAACWAGYGDAEARLREAVQQAGRGRAAQTEVRTCGPAGAAMTFDLSVRPVFDDAGRVILLVCEGYDVTPRRRTDIVLRDLLDGLGDAVGAGFFAALVEHLCRSLDVDAALLAESSTPDLLRTLAVWSSGRLTPNFETDLAGTPFERLADRRVTAYATGVLKAFPRDRVLRDLQADAYVGLPLLGIDGQPIGVLAVIHSRPLDDLAHVTDVLRLFGGRAAAELERSHARRDIVAIQEALERRVEERAADAQRRAQALDEVDCGVAVLEAEVVHVANETFARLYGYGSPSAIAGRRWRDLHVSTDAAGGEVDPVLFARRHGRWRGDLVARRRDGTRFDVDVAVRRTPQGDLVCTCRDVSRERHAEAAWRQQVHQLTAANADLSAGARAQDMCIASMNHELRTPLHVILGLAEALRDAVHGQMNDAQARSVHGIESSARHLLDVVNDFRDLASLSASELELDRAAVDVRTIVDESVRPLRPTIRERHLSIATSFDDAVGTVWADQRRLRRVLTALLTDAASRTPTGGRFGIDVTAQHPPGSVAFTVWDSADTPAPASADGKDARTGATATGDAALGPASALLFRLIEFHGGTVTLDSGRTQGTRVSVVLPPPSTAPQPAAAPPVTAADSEPLRLSTRGAILLAEDNETNVRFLSDYLEAIGYRVVVARDGREAVDRALVEPPALVLMDIQMPGLDGLEAIRLMRGEPKLAGVPIVALTALAMPGDRERCLAAGANAYVSKPLSLKELRAMLAAYLGPPAAPDLPRHPVGGRS